MKSVPAVLQIPAGSYTGPPLLPDSCQDQPEEGSPDNISTFTISWDFTTGMAPASGSSRHLPSTWNLVLKVMSALTSCSFTLASLVQPGHFSGPFILAVVTLPMASPVHRADDNNLFFSPVTYLLSSLKEHMPKVSRMADSQMLIHPHLPLSLSPTPTPSALFPHIVPCP